jgi:hypothetical protein
VFFPLFQAPFSVQAQNNPHHPGDITNHHHSTSTSSGAGGSGKQSKSQIKEKSSKSTPVAHFGKGRKKKRELFS